MKRVLDRITERKARFASLDLFRRLEREGSVDDVRAFAPALTFFVMAFQDVLRLNAARVNDPALAAFARQHRDEDAGHDAWFLHDLRELDADVGIGDVFKRDHETTRDTSYALIAQALHLDDDFARIALLFALEATGDAIFRRAPAFLERAGFAGTMRYFSKRHYEVESAHDLHDAGVSASLAKTTLDPASFKTASAVVELTFDAMTSMVESFEAKVVRARSGIMRVGSDQEKQAGSG